MTDKPYNPNDTSTYIKIQLTKLEGTTKFVTDDKGYMIMDKNGDYIEEDEYELLFYKDKKKYYPYIISYKGKPISINPKNSDPNLDSTVNIKQYNILSSSNIGTVKVNLIPLINDDEFKRINPYTMEKKGKFYKLKFDREQINEDNLYGEYKLSCRIPINKFKKWTE
jgi:hypothetical protein